MNEIEKVDTPECQTDTYVAEVKEWNKREAKSLKLRARHMQKKLLSKINELKGYIHSAGSTDIAFADYYIKSSLSLQLEAKHMLSSLQRIEKCLELPIGTYSGELQGAAEALYWKDIDEYEAALKLLSELETRYYCDARTMSILGKTPEYPSPEPSEVIEQEEACLTADMEKENE